MAKCARRRREPRAAAVVSDGGRGKRAGALDHKRPRQDLIGDIAQHRLALTGEVGLVQRQAIALHQRAVGDHLIAGHDPHEIAHHDLVDRHLTWCPVADHGRPRRDERGQFVQRTLGADLLKRPDRDARPGSRETKASLAFPKISVAAPNSARIKLNTVKVFATTIDR